MFLTVLLQSHSHQPDRSLQPAHTTCFKSFGSLKGEARNWTPDNSVTATHTRVITICLTKGLFPFSPLFSLRLISRVWLSKRNYRSSVFKCKTNICPDQHRKWPSKSTACTCLVSCPRCCDAWFYVCFVSTHLFSITVNYIKLICDQAQPGEVVDFATFFSNPLIFHVKNPRFYF